ncbi:TlpA disulfide reductase family protein [Dyadobacter sp. 676]|uniref:TlpA disulfide reductase family protein n=1 Tax=Dyadobacter sp. 676 TaxID=3088362 RepID=A0AAU8FMV7_9BACT
MKIALAFLISTGVLLFTASFAQTRPDNAPIRYLNNFYKYTSTELNADSALFYLRKIESNKLSSERLPNVIHEEFAQQILDRSFPAGMDTSKINAFRRVQAFHKKLMPAIMADTSQLIKQIIKPLYLYLEIREHINDDRQLADITGRFVRETLSGPDIYRNRTGRYALMIYPILNSKPELKPQAEKLLETANAGLEKGLAKASENSTQNELTQRAWHRYLYAYMNVIKSEREPDSGKRKAFLKTAYDYSPDVIDRQHQWAYFYDMYIMFRKEKSSFREEYLQYLTAHSDQNNLLSTLLEIALQQPEYKERLKTAYLKINGPQADFPKFWMASVNNYAQTAPPISLSMLDKSRFSNSAAEGKWLLVDFWGTWCGPCRAEHPEMQKFYESSIKTNADKIALLTIACRDTEAKVTTYMTEKNFSFPVAMSDNKIEHTYKVPGYPTKLLITPAGKYIFVPSGNDWISFVKHYTDL